MTKLLIFFKLPPTVYSSLILLLLRNIFFEMRYSLSLLITMFLLLSRIASGQYYETGQDPSSLKWKQIKTGRFTVIYPEDYEAGGIAFAQSLENAYTKLGGIFPEKKFRIPVILHNYTARSNGYVAWAPRRMEIYPTPEQNTIPLDPNTQLAVHELTHVIQMESLNRGFSKVLTFGFGEQVTGLVASLLPDWFLEGDAVFAETALTNSGRGRNASFQKQLKALTIENGKAYKYDKSHNGSYRDYVPDHYQSGYQIVTWAMAKYDPQIWNRVIKFTAEQPFTLSPVNISLNRSSGLNKRRLYDQTFDTLRSIWTEELLKEKAVKYETLNPDKRGKYINYYSPVYAGNNNIVAIKTTLSSTPEFVLINLSDKSEVKIHMPGQIYPYLISYGNGKIVWVEFQSDLRWENREYSVIKILDLSSRRVQKLSRKSRYMSASISPDGEMICAVENTIQNTNNLVFIESGTGKIINSLPAPGNSYLQRPQWSAGGEKVTVINLTEAGEGILSYSLTNKDWDTLVNPGIDDLQSTFLSNDSLFFISSQSGTDNIFLRTPDGNISGLTRSRFGANDLSVTGKRIVFSDYSSTGNSICTSLIEPSPLTIKEVTTSPDRFLDRIEIKQPVSADTIVKDYTPVPYRKWQHLFRFHSWMPFYADLEEIKSDPASIRPGLMILTQNSLSTLISSIGYEYTSDKKHVIHSKVTWKGLFPVLESQLDYGDNALVYKSGESVTDPADIKPGVTFTNSLSFPFHFTSGNFYENLYLYATSEYQNRYVYVKATAPDVSAYDYGQTILTGRIYFSNYSRTTFRDIYPRWAQTFDLNYTFAPFDKEIYGTGTSLKTAFYFPGFLPDNGIKIRAEKEVQNPSTYLYGNRVSYPRGYNNIVSRELSFLSADYVMPLIYPDLSIGSLLYLKRIRGGVFYDYAEGTGNYYLDKVASGNRNEYYHDYKENFSSSGFSLLADFHIMRIPYMISGGFQAAWKDMSQKPVIEILLNIDLFGTTLGNKRL